MRHPKPVQFAYRCTCMLMLTLWVGACGSSDETSSNDLPPITDEQAEAYGKQLVETACKKLSSCLQDILEDQGAQPDKEIEEMQAEACIEESLEQAQTNLKACKHWDEDLAETCIEDLVDAKCPPNGGTLTVDTCDELGDKCELEDVTGYSLGTLFSQLATTHCHL